MLSQNGLVSGFLRSVGFLQFARSVTLTCDRLLHQHHLIGLYRIKYISMFMCFVHLLYTHANIVHMRVYENFDFDLMFSFNFDLAKLLRNCLCVFAPLRCRWKVSCFGLLCVFSVYRATIAIVD